MSFYGHGYRGYGVLPTFDTAADNVYLGALSAKIAQAQATSSTAAALATAGGAAAPLASALAGQVKGLEQAIASALTELSTAVSRVKATNANTGSTGAEVDKPMLSQFNYSGGGGQFQAALLAWRLRPGNAFYRPDEGDYQYPGGAGQLDAAQTDWKNASRKAADNARDALSGLLDQFNSKVAAAADAVQKAVDASTSVVVAQNKEATAVHEVAAEKAQKEVVQAHVDLATTAAKADKAIRDIANPPMSPILIAALVGVPVIGVIAYALTRKKSSSVAGYRRRRSRR